MSNQDLFSDFGQSGNPGARGIAAVLIGLGALISATATAAFFYTFAASMFAFISPDLSPWLAAVAGVFLFLGRKLMSGNSFLQRIRDAVVETDRLEPDHPIKMIGRTRTNIFTLIQMVCLAGLWGFKECNATAIFFPSVIGMLMVIRSYFLPKYFTTRELAALGEVGDGELHT